MRYVRRNEQDAIVETAKWPIDGVVDERLADDHPDIVAFNTPDYMEQRRNDMPNMRDQLDQLWKLEIAKGLVPDTSNARDLNTPEGMSGEIEVVKQRYPKQV